MCMLHQRSSGPMKRTMPIKGSRSRISFKRLLAYYICVIIFLRVCRRPDRIGLGRKGGTKKWEPRLASGWWRIVSLVSREGRTGGFFLVGNLAFNLGKPLANTFPRRILRNRVPKTLNSKYVFVRGAQKMGKYYYF